MPSLFPDDIMARIAMNPKTREYLQDPNFVTMMNNVMANPQALQQV